LEKIEIIYYVLYMPGTHNTSFLLLSFLLPSFLSNMSDLTFRANTCDHMIYDGACDCNERRVADEPDFLTTFMAEVAEVVPRSLFRDPDGHADIVEYDPRPSQMDLAILGSMAFCGIRRRLRSEAGIESSAVDSMEITASMNVAKANPEMHHSTEEFLSLFNSETAKMISNQAQAEEHVEDERLIDQAEFARLREYENDVAEVNDGETEEQAYLDACDACSYSNDDRYDGYYSPHIYGESNYYDESWTGYEGNDW
jgi:hypothetical protein